MKNKLMPVIIHRLMLFFLIVCPSMVFAAESFPRPLIIDDHLKIISQQSLQKNQTPRVFLQLNYPQIIGDSVPENAEKFNRLVKLMVDAQVEKFERGLQRAARAPSSSTFHVDYHIYTLTPHSHHIISVVFTSTALMPKYAHPIHTMASLNYDLTTGRQLTLSDLFEPHSGYRTSIARYCKAFLKKKFPDALVFEKGLEPTPENYDVWSLRATGIVIHFNEAHVLPRIYGTLEVAVPYDALEEVPLSPFIAPCLESPVRCVAPGN